MPRGNMEFNLEIDPEFDEIIDEGVGNSFIALRRLRWNENGQFKLDFRKWITDAEGKEIAGKGCSFITEEGPSNLVHTLLAHGYGDTQTVVEKIADRPDFIDALMYSEKALGNLDLDDLKEKIKKKSETAEEVSFYDPKELLG